MMELHILYHSFIGEERIMLTNYTERKKEVLVEYGRFEEEIESLERIIIKAGLPSPIAQFKTSLDDIRRKAKNIRDDRFRLMIVGEAKSGKSTFINAYLGVELMPMDEKQCTSSIVEIKYGTEFRLVATYADGKTYEVKDETDIRSFLKTNAALDENYRDIPVPTINHDLLVRYGKKSQSEYAIIPKSIMESFLSAPEIKDANIHNISNYNSKIRSYIENRKNNWRSIVVKIEIFFPFEDEALKGIEIIDSPGVAARGGVAEITASYIENADAIIFLKPMSGQALESSQFTEFMKNASVERNKNALFLVLTHAINHTPSGVKRLEDEAYKQFKQLPSKNIIVVDSKAELYAEMFSTVVDVQARIRELNASGDLDEFVKGIWFDAMGNKNAFINGLKQKSNFEKIDEALSVFGRKAHYIALSSLLDLISKVYTRIIGDLNSHIARFKEKAEDPSELAKKIGEIKQELEVINNKMYRGVDRIVSRYSSDDSDIKKNANRAAEDFKKQTEIINANDSNCFNELERQAIHKIDEFKNLQDLIQKAVVQECNATLIAITNEGEIPYTSLEPDFSEDTFKNIKDSTKSKANETHSYETGVTFKKTHTYSEYSRNKHFKIVKDNILTRLETIKNDLIINLVDFVVQISKQYMNKLRLNAESKKEELDAIFEAKLNAEQIKIVIDNLNVLTIDCNDCRRNADRIKGGIDKYVQQST